MQTWNTASFIHENPHHDWYNVIDPWAYLHPTIQQKNRPKPFATEKADLDKGENYGDKVFEYSMDMLKREMEK